MTTTTLSIQNTTTVAEIVKAYKKVEIINLLAEYGVFIANVSRVKKEVLAKELLEAIEVEAMDDPFEVIDSRYDSVSYDDSVLTAEDTGLSIDRIDYGEEEEATLETATTTDEVRMLSTKEKIEISKATRTACLENKLSVVGISVYDLTDVIRKVVYQEAAFEVKEVKEVIGCDRYGNAIYKTRTVSSGRKPLGNDQQELIEDTISRMVDQGCIRSNKAGTFFYLTSKLLHWNFAS